MDRYVSSTSCHQNDLKNVTKHYSAQLTVNLATTKFLYFCIFGLTLNKIKHPDTKLEVFMTYFHKYDYVYLSCILFFFDVAYISKTYAQNHPIRC